MTPTPFTIDIPDSEVADLRTRLRATRFPDVPANTDFARGTSGEYLRELVRYWAEEYDWPARQAELNQIPQFTAEIDGRPIHFLSARSERQDATPLLLLHGWPDSPFRFRTVIPLLTDPPAGQPAFHVIAPSLPGFHFSGHEAQSSDATADLLATLMTDELGHERFLVAGGDVGTGVGMALGRRHPGLVVGLHLTNVDYPTGQEPDLTEAEQEYAAYIQQWWFTQGAYAAVQSTKPQIVGPALTDSPAGLAAFMLGLIDTGADNHDVEASFGGRDELLTNFSLYHFTATAGSAADSYYVESNAGEWGATPAKVEVPTGVAIFPREAPSPREWCERQANVVRYTRMDRGGHFAALEVPDDYVGEIRAFARDLAADG